MARKKKKKAAGCKSVVFARSSSGRKLAKPKKVAFCKKEASPNQKEAKAFRAKMVLKHITCAKPSKLTPALKKACKSKKLPSAAAAARFFEFREAGKRVGII